MKYRPTPFNLVSLYFLFETIRLSVISAKDDRADLGSLFLFYYLGIFIAVIFIDFLIQLAFFKGKGSWKMLYLTQLITLGIMAIFIFRQVIAHVAAY